MSLHTNYILQFAYTKGIGNITIRKALSFLSQYGYSWEELCTSKTLLSCGLGLRSDLIDNVIANYNQGVSIASRMESDGISLLTEADSDYPHILSIRMKKKAPSLLFIKGEKALLGKHAVGFCGSRKTSDKGIAITTDCASQIVKNNIAVVSGYANGTDIAAHKAALENNGSTVFVLAEGLFNVCVKNSIREVIRNNNHYIFVSQFLPDEKWSPGNAMKRNGTIIGLSDAMVLVESGMSGGTYAAGEETLTTNTPLFVVDYAHPPETAIGNSHFISEGATPIRSKNGRAHLTKLISKVISSDKKEI